MGPRKESESYLNQVSHLFHYEDDLLEYERDEGCGQDRRNFKVD